MKRFKLPAWLPTPRSWLRAGFLSLVFIFFLGFIAIIHPGETGFKKILEVPLEILLLGIFLLVTFPIPLIAFWVEIYHQMIDFFIPQASQIKSNRSFFPSLMSWWEGLYGWLVMILSSLITGTTALICQPLVNWIYENLNYNYIDEFNLSIRGLLLLIWIGVAATFYEIQDLSQKRIDRQQLEIFLEQSLSEFELPPQPLPIVQPAPKVYKYKRKKIRLKWLKKIQFNAQKIRQLFQKLLLPLLLLLGIMRSYGWVQLSQLYEATLNQNIVATSTPAPHLKTAPNMKSEAPLPVPYVPKPAPKSSKIKLQMPPTLPVDPFQQAIYKATTAANLTQMAESPREWQAIAQQWQDAIDLMKTVPVSNPNYSIAQQKVREYQENLQYAQAAASGNSR